MTTRLSGTRWSAITDYPLYLSGVLDACRTAVTETHPRSVWIWVRRSCDHGNAQATTGAALKRHKNPQPLPNSSLLNLLELARTIHSAMCTAKQDLPWDTRQALRVLPNKRST